MTWRVDCRDRIANHLFDDPPRLVPPEPDKAKVALEMDDKKSHKVGAFLPRQIVMQLVHHMCNKRMPSCDDSCVICLKAETDQSSLRI